MLHVSLEPEVPALKWAKKAGFTWNHIMQVDAKKLDLFKLYEGYVPRYVLVDKDGKVLAEGIKKSKAKINSLK